jgi:NADH dehydrogenase
MAKSRPVIVIIGAGFGGLQCALKLRKHPVDVVLIDRRNHHLFQPLLYQVATAALSPSDIAYPIRRTFRKSPNVMVALGEVTEIDLVNRTYGGDGHTFPYDYLVIAVGATHSYFGKPEWEKYAPGIKTLEDAIEVRKRMLIAFEEAEYEADEESRKAKLTFVIVGGGPTGVEMAGALREIAADDFQRDFKNIDTKTTQIILLQGGDRLLPGMDPKLSARAKHDLEAMGVNVRPDARVTNIDADGVWIGDEQVRASNVLWAAGVQASPLLKALGVPLDKAGRVIVNPDLSVPNQPRVFVVGDAAAVIDPETKQPVPGLAPAAMQMGRFVAKTIIDDINRPDGARLGSPTQPRPAFKYVDKGTLATIGVRRAVADIRGWKFGGFFAWAMWCLIHVMFLISFRNKLAVMWNWFEQYLTGSREVRLITGNYRLNLKKVRKPNMSS